LSQLDSAVRWRPWSIAVVLAIFISLYALGQFNLFSPGAATWAGCGLLALSGAWNVHVLLRARSRSKPGRHPEIADGLLLAGLILVFFGAFF
jgi:hypothetical protein